MVKRLPDPPGIGRWESLTLMKRCDFDFVRVYRHLQQRFGDVFSLYLPTLRYVVLHPDATRHVLKDNHGNYTKSADYKELAPMLGDGLLNSEGELWKRQRRLISGEFTHDRIKQHGEMMVRKAEAVRDRWIERSRTGETFDLSSDMMALTFAVVGSALFGSDVEAAAEQVGEAFASAAEASTTRMFAVMKAPLWVPTPNSLRYRRAIAVLDELIYGIIEKRRKNPTENPDLLSRLMKASEAEGSPMTPKLLRDELVTFVLAGHETTSLALTWTFFLLGKNPDKFRALRRELDEVLGGRAVTVADLPRLTMTRAILQESMRIYPPVPGVSRCPIKDDAIGGFHIEAGSLVSCVPAIVHKDPRFWEAPEEFRPERFLPSSPVKPVPFSYLPFGAGPRVCVGEHFAMMESLLLLATLAPHYNFEIDPQCEVVPQSLLTFRPKYGFRGRMLPIS